MYLVTSAWRGKLHVDSMRSFLTLGEAITYAIRLDRRGEDYRLYKTHPNKPPENLSNKKDIKEQINPRQ